MIDYRAATDISDPNVVRFFEQYEDAAAFETHSQIDHFQEFEARLSDLLAGEPEVLQFEVDSATELELYRSESQARSEPRGQSPTDHSTARRSVVSQRLTSHHEPPEVLEAL